MQRLSIIVPFMGNPQRFEDTLVSVLENQPEYSEVVVVLNGPYDDPYKLQGEVKFVETPQGTDLADCFAYGLAASSGPVVHVLAAGFEATPGWADAALARFAEPDVAAVVPVVVDREHPGQILSAGLRWTRAGSIVRIAAGIRLDRFVADDCLFNGPELVAAFYRRDVLETVDSLQLYGNDLAAAMNLALAVRKAGYRLVQEPVCVTTATGGLFAARGAWGEGIASEQLFRRWTAPIPGTDKQNGWKRSWAAHWGMIALDCLRFPLRPSLLAGLGGRFWAMMGFGSRTAAIIPPARESQKDAVIRPRHFGAADARPKLHSRAAG